MYLFTRLLLSGSRGNHVRHHESHRAVSQHWSVQIPAMALYGGLGAALVIGAIAGLYPSMRAARLSPTEALRTV
jgi:ABC-type lipoprotein release transport system permease subunit